jgi:type I restriction enzyme M protein
MIEYPNDSTEYRVITAEKLLETLKSIKAKIKGSESELGAKTKETIESLTDEQIRLLLEEKWIVPLVTDVFAMPKVMLKKFIADIKNLSCKYDTTLLDIDSEISAVENGLHKLLGDLTGHEDDIVGIQALQQLLGGE